MLQDIEVTILKKLEETKVLASLQWHHRVCSFLKGALPEDKTLTDGMTALHLAARRGHGAVVRI